MEPQELKKVPIVSYKTGERVVVGEGLTDNVGLVNVNLEDEITSEIEQLGNGSYSMSIRKYDDFGPIEYELRLP
jgi:hypothetical protein